MGTNILQNIKRAGLALALVAASAFALAQSPQSGTVVQMGRTANADGMTDVAACGSTTNFDSDSYLVDLYVVLMKDGTVKVNGQPSGLTGITAISVGPLGYLALRLDGTVVQGSVHQAGNFVSLPASIHDVVSIYAGFDDFLAVKADGSVLAWYSNGTLKSDTPPTDPVNPVVKVTSSVAGSRLFLHRDGTVTAQGSWYTTNFDTIPIVVPAGLTDVVDISMSSKCAMALKSDHTIVCFGPQASEAQSRFLGGNYESIASGLDYSMALQNDGFTSSLQYFCLPDTLFSLDNAEILLLPPGLAPIALGGGVGSYTPMVIVPGFDGKITLNGNSLVGGSTQFLTLTVTLNTPASEDRELPINSRNGILELGYSVTVPKGKKSATFPLYAFDVDSLRLDSFTVDDKWGGWVHINPNQITGLKFSSSSLEGGQNVTATVTLAQASRGGTLVHLTSDNSKVTVADAVVRSGSKTGTTTFRTSAVTQTTQVNITATYGTSSWRTATLTLQPRPVVKSVTLASSMYGHQQITGTVNLAQAAGSAGATVTISGDGLTVPSTITIPAGGKTGTFTVTADDPSAATLHHLMFSTATSAMGKDVTVKPITLSTITLASPSAQAGTSTTGTVTLAQPVAVDTVITLASAKPTVASVPATVTIPAGSSSASFSITTYVKTQGNVTITASKNASVRRVILAVTK